MILLTDKIFTTIDPIFKHLRENVHNAQEFDQAIKFIFQKLNFTPLEQAIAHSRLNHLFMDQQPNPEAIETKSPLQIELRGYDPTKDNNSALIDLMNQLLPKKLEKGWFENVFTEEMLKSGDAISFIAYSKDEQKYIGIIIILKKDHTHLIYHWIHLPEYDDYHIGESLLINAMNYAYEKFKIFMFQIHMRQSKIEDILILEGKRFKRTREINKYYSNGETAIELEYFHPDIEKIQDEYRNAIINQLSVKLRDIKSRDSERIQGTIKTIERAFEPFLNKNFDWNQALFSVDYIRYSRAQGANEYTTNIENVTVNFKDIIRIDDVTKLPKDKGVQIRFNWQQYTYDKFDPNVTDPAKQWLLNIPLNKISGDIFYRKKEKIFMPKLQGWIQFLVDRQKEFKEIVEQSKVNKFLNLVMQGKMNQTIATTHDWESKKLVGVYPINEDWEYVLDDSPIAVFSKSTGQLWADTSCEDENGCNWHLFPYDIERSSIVCFVRSKYTGVYVARVMLRWCECDGNPNKVSWGIEPRFYASSERDMVQQLPSLVGKPIKDVINNFYTDQRKINHPDWSRDYNYKFLLNKDGTFLSMEEATNLLHQIILSHGYSVYYECKTPYTFQGWSDMGDGVGNVIKYVRFNYQQDAEDLLKYAESIQCPKCKTYLFHIIFLNRKFKDLNKQPQSTFDNLDRLWSKKFLHGFSIKKNNEVIKVQGDDGWGIHEYYAEQASFFNIYMNWLYGDALTIGSEFSCPNCSTRFIYRINDSPSYKGNDLEFFEFSNEEEEFLNNFSQSDVWEVIKNSPDAQQITISPSFIEALNAHIERNDNDEPINLINSIQLWAFPAKLTDKTIFTAFKAKINEEYTEFLQNYNPKNLVTIDNNQFDWFIPCVNCGIGLVWQLKLPLAKIPKKIDNNLNIRINAIIQQAYRNLHMTKFFQTKDHTCYAGGYVYADYEDGMIEIYNANFESYQCPRCNTFNIFLFSELESIQNKVSVSFENHTYIGVFVDSFFTRIHRLFEVLGGINPEKIYYHIYSYLNHRKVHSKILKDLIKSELFQHKSINVKEATIEAFSIKDVPDFDKLNQFILSWLKIPQELIDQVNKNPWKRDNDLINKISRLIDLDSPLADKKSIKRRQEMEGELEEEPEIEEIEEIEDEELEEDFEEEPEELGGDLEIEPQIEPEGQGEEEEGEQMSREEMDQQAREAEALHREENEE